MLKVSLVTPEKKFLTDADVEELIVPGERGELDILPGHSPLVTTLAPGILRYRPAGQTEFKKVAISWGYCEVSPIDVKVLAATAETPEQVNRESAQQALNEAQEKLQKSGLPLSEVEKHQRDLQAARARLELA